MTDQQRPPNGFLPPDTPPAEDSVEAKIRDAKIEVVSAGEGLRDAALEGRDHRPAADRLARAHVQLRDLGDVSTS